jgi:hypothetical protein
MGERGQWQGEKPEGGGGGRKAMTLRARPWGQDNVLDGEHGGDGSGKTGGGGGVASLTHGRQSDTVNVMYALTSQHIIACPHRPHFPPTLPPPSPAGAPPNTRQTPKAQSTPPRLAQGLSPHSSTSSQHRCGPSLPRRVAGPANPGPPPPPPPTPPHP